MKIPRYMFVIVSVLVIGLVMNAGCKKGAQEGAAAALEDAGDSTTDTGSDEAVAFTIKAVALVLPNQEEVGTDSKRLSRHSKIKVTYEGELPSDIGLKSGDDAVEYTVLSDSDGELLVKPKMPMHNLEMYELGDFSFTVKAPGDINGDGLSDFVVGAPLKSNFGVAYVFYGVSPLNYGLSATTSANVRLLGNVANAEFGNALALGDVNGDGYADIAIGAPNEDQGCVYVFHGSDALQDTVANGAENARICRDSGSVNGEFGGSVAFGDLNGDGFDDLIIGEPLGDGAHNSLTNLADAGVVKVLFGSSNGIASKNINALNQADNSYHSITKYQKAGYSVAASDVTGDGFDDVIIGAIGSNTPPAADCVQGKVFIINGASDLLDTGKILVLESKADQTLTGQGCINDETDRFGVSVAAAGGEEKDRALIGSESNSYVYSLGSPMDFLLLSLPPHDVIVGWLGNAIGLGSPSSDILRYRKPDSPWQSIQGAANSAYGCAISPAGDLDGDGEPDFIIGARMYSNNRGKIVVNIDDETVVGVTGSEFGTAVAGGRIR